MMAHEIPCAATMAAALDNLDALEAALLHDDPKNCGGTGGYQFRALGLFIAVEANSSFDMSGDGDYIAQLAIDMPTARKLLAPLRDMIAARLAELGVTASPSSEGQTE